MRCAYCFYCDVAASRHEASMGFMTRDIAAAVIRNIFCELEAGDHITFAFQGGEPGLAGLDFFVYFVSEVIKNATSGITINYAFQTNGLMVDEAWCCFFKEHSFLVGLSLDGDADLHNCNRIDNLGKGTFNRVMEAKKLFDHFKVDYNILCVLSSGSARRANRIWNFIIREKISHIQFIPCLEPLNGESVIALTSDKFYRFYSNIFLNWKREADKGTFVVIRLFEELATFLLTGRAVTCGVSGRCTPQFIVEADGSVYPCDFYVLDEYRTGNLTVNNIREIFDALVSSHFLMESVKTPVNSGCLDCAHAVWCRGGCKRMAQAVYGDNCGMRLFLDEHLNDLLSVYKK